MAELVIKDLSPKGCVPALAFGSRCSSPDLSYCRPVPSTTSLLDVRGKLYELLINCIPSDVILAVRGRQCAWDARRVPTLSGLTRFAVRPRSRSHES